LPPQFPRQLPFSDQQLYAPPDAEFPRDFPAPVPAPSYEPPAPVYTSKTYRLQVGAFKSIIHAQYAYDAVSATGLSPALENLGELYRVVIPYIPEANVYECVEILRMAGFSSVWIREE
jgi:cell division protein FtsN